MSHAEPFLLRTFYGDPDKLAADCRRDARGRRGRRAVHGGRQQGQLHQRKGKLQRMKASLKQLDYDPKRDFVGWGGDGEAIDEFKTIELLAASTGPWKFIAAKRAGATGGKWIEPTFDDAKWAEGKAPDRLRRGRDRQAQGHDRQGGGRKTSCSAARSRSRPSCSNARASSFASAWPATTRPACLSTASWWTRTRRTTTSSPTGTARSNCRPRPSSPGKNLIAVMVKNHQGSHDLYLDLELTAQYPLPRPRKKKPPAVAVGPTEPAKAATPVAEEPAGPERPEGRQGQEDGDDRRRRGARKLPTLDQIYPIEVIGTLPRPAGPEAHETVLTFKGVRPSDVHKALESLGLKPGKPAYGEGAPSRRARGQSVRRSAPARTARRSGCRSRSAWSTATPASRCRR